MIAVYRLVIPVAAAIVLFGFQALAQEPEKSKPAKSSDEAILQFADAVNFQNGGKFDLAADEYADFLKRYADDPLAPKAWHYLGVCKLKLQKYDEAAAAAQKAVSLGGAKFELADEANYFLGLANYRLGEAAKNATEKGDRMKKAAAALGTVAAKFPESKLVPQALYYAAEAHYAVGAKNEAVKSYQMLVEDHPRDALAPDALYGMGFALEELGQTAEAAAAYDTFLKNHGTHKLLPDVQLRRGETLLTAKKFEEAAPLFAKAAGTEGFEDADHATMQQASCLYELKQYEAAAKLYGTVPAKYPQSREKPLAWMNAGKALMNLSKFAEARGAFANLASAGDANLATEAAYLLTRCLLREKKPGEAEAAAAAALAKAAGTKWEPQLMLAAADATYDQPEKRKEAAGRYLAVAEKFPREAVAADASFMAAYASLQGEDPKRAVALAGEFLKKYGSHALAPEASAVVAESNLLLKDFPAAEKQFRELVAKHAGHRDVALWKRRLGYALLLADKHTEAVAQLGPLVASIKDADALGDIHYWLATAHYKQQHHDEALAAAQASLAAAPQGRNADRALLITAEAYAAKKDFGKAIAAAENIAQEFDGPLEAEALYRVANYTARSGKSKEAIARYEKMLEGHGDSEFAPYARHGVAIAQLEQKDYAAAEKALGELIEKHAAHSVAADARLDRATARQFLGKYKEAAEDASAFLEGKPAKARMAAARHVLGLCQDRLKQPAEAVKTFQALLADDPNYADTPGVLYELGWSLRTLKREEEARAAFARLAKDFGNTPFAAEAHYLLGEYHFGDKAYDKARAEYEAAAKNLPSGTLGEKILHRLGWTFYRLKDYGKAEEAFAKQLASAGDGELSGPGVFMLGEARFHAGKHAEAVEAYQRALAKTLANKDYEVLALLHAGQSASQLKKWEEAISLLDRLVKNHADNYYVPEAMYEQGWAKRNLGDDAAAEGKTSQANKLYDEALVLFDGVARKTTREVGARSRFMMGEVHFLRKNYREALRNYLKVAEGYPDAAAEVAKWKAKAAFSLGHVYTAMKLPDEARQWFQNTIERYPMSEEASAAKERLGKTSG